jgi:hypothetical protein
MLGIIREWLRRQREARRKALMFEAAVVVTMDEETIRAAYPDDSVQSIAWKDIERVAIETNDTGPRGADVWWLFEGREGRCAYPQGATGDAEVIEGLSTRFPGFSYEAVINAQSCTSNARFLCWERKRPSHQDGLESA